MLTWLFIGLSAVAANTAVHSIPNVSAARIFRWPLFPFRLVTVGLTGSELFTGTCLMTNPVLSGRVSVSGMLRQPPIVYLENFAGALDLAAACALNIENISSVQRYSLTLQNKDFFRAISKLETENQITNNLVLRQLVKKARRGRVFLV